MDIEKLTKLLRQGHQYSGIISPLEVMAADTIDRITAERDGYRDALETIASGTKDLVPPYRAMPESSLREIARAALAALTPAVSDADKN